jgi:phosphonate transport system substrate-binding protein
VANNTLAADYLDTLRQQLTQNQDKLIEALISVEANRKFQGAEIVAVQDSDYDMVREAYQSIGVNDFTEFVGD